MEWCSAGVLAHDGFSDDDGGPDVEALGRSDAARAKSQRNVRVSIEALGDLLGFNALGARIDRVLGPAVSVQRPTSGQHLARG
jgi:hypothetical protein